MKPYAIILLTLTSYATFAQQPIQEHSPKKVWKLDLSPDGALKFEQDEARYILISKKLEQGTKLEQLPADDQRIYTEKDETVEGYWDVFGTECSWYCGGSVESVTASSALKAQGENTYAAENAHDFNCKNAWAEGVAGAGVGEYLVYTFPPRGPRITEIIVVNGYVKSERAYRDNGRVKKLKVYVNNQPFAILNLEDSRSRQFFPFPPIGNDPGDKKLSSLPPLTLKFEILEVYKGARYDDTVISEIYFDGIDVH